MGPGFFYRRRRLDRRMLVRALALSVVVGLLTLVITAAVQMRPLLASLATTKVSNTVTRIVSEAVYQAIEDGEIRYDGLVTFEKDETGQITAVRSNMAAFNHLQADILDTITVSAGKIGCQVELSPTDLIGLVGAETADLTV